MRGLLLLGVIFLFFSVCGYVRCDVNLSHGVYNGRSLHFVISLPAGEVRHAVVAKSSSVIIQFSGVSMMELQTTCLQQSPHASPLSIRCITTATPEGGAALELDLAGLAAPVVTVNSHAGLKQLIVGVHDAPVLEPALYSPSLQLA